MTSCLSTYKCGNSQIVVPANSFSQPLRPQSQQHEHQREDHEGDGQANHHTLGVIVIHRGGAVACGTTLRHSGFNDEQNTRAESRDPLDTYKGTRTRDKVCRSEGVIKLHKSVPTKQRRPNALGQRRIFSTHRLAQTITCIPRQVLGAQSRYRAQAADCRISAPCLPRDSHCMGQTATLVRCLGRPSRPFPAQRMRHLRAVTWTDSDKGCVSWVPVRDCSPIMACVLLGG